MSVNSGTEPTHSVPTHGRRYQTPADRKTHALTYAHGRPLVGSVPVAHARCTAVAMETRGPSQAFCARSSREGLGLHGAQVAAPRADERLW